MTSSAKPRIWHVSADFPDPIAPDKTPVFQRLLDLTKDRFEHRVISINRVGTGAAGLAKAALSSEIQVERQLAFERGVAIAYRAPGRGALHATMLERLGQWIAREAMELGPPDLIIAHKLTLEGIAVAEAARLLGVPYATIIQGDTDTKIMAVRRDLRGRFARIFAQAAATASLAPWSLEAVERFLRLRHPHSFLVPGPTGFRSILPPLTPGNGFISVFHLKNARRKNLAGMCRALKGIETDHPAVRLAIVGDGSRKDQERCERLIGGLGSVDLEGGLSGSQLRARMQEASGFLLPSLRESFGLVFVEALMNGLPIIYPSGAALDGYFGKEPFAVRVDARKPHEISAAMRHILANEAELKRSLASWQTSKAAEIFGDKAIAQTFGAFIDSAIRRARPLSQAASVPR